MEPPLFPAGGPQTVRAAPGTVASLVLPLPFGSPPIQYEWSRAGASLDERFITSEDAGGVRLTVSAARIGDSGVYTLQASNVAGKDTTRVRLEVSPEEAPVGDDPPNFLRRLQDLTVKVGTRTRFLVEIVSSTECKVTWYRNERRLMETERVALVRDGNFWCADVATVSVDDAGRWTCTAENLGGRASCSAHLNVLVPKAYKRPEFVEELRALLTEQGTVSLECKVVGVPTPVLRWFKDSCEIKAGDVFALTANADDPTSLGTYTCEAVNCMGRAYSSSKVHVVGRASREGSMRPSSGGLTPDPPPIFTKELEDQFVRICESLTLSCHIVVPPWPRSVVWYNKEGKIEPSERYHVLEDGVGGYLLEVRSAEWADEGEWKCVASTAGGRVGMSACYVSMDVPKNYRKPRFMENLQAVLTEEGLVSFECKVVGFPTPVLSWFKDGQELKPGDVYQLTGTNSLGSYCCIAKNCMGQASSSAELTVEDIQNQLNEEEKHQLFSKNQAPKFLQGLKSVEVKIDEPFRFTIKVAIPPEPSLLWYRDEQPVDESTRCHHGKEDRGVFYLDIQNLEFLDQAEWKCVAMNDFGQSVTSCFLKLIIPRHYKKPRFLENLQAILSDEGAVNLECKVIGVPQPVLKWYKDGEELKPGDIHRIISGQDGTCCLGTYTCEAQNCMGIASSSASLLGFDDSMKVKSKKKSEEQTLQRNLSLSTIHEERTSQMYDTPVGDRTLDDKGEISFSFDGKEVSVSLYETPDLTEEEALQIVEMYADQLSENVTEHNVVELPPLRFVKETSTSGNLLMEAIIIDVSPEYFASPEEDLRTEADIEDISIADENGPPQISLDQEISSQDYLEKTMALLSDEKADIPKKLGRKMSDSQRSVDDYFSLSRDHSLSEEKKDDDTQILSESDLQSFASAKSSAKLKSKTSKPSMDDQVLEIVEVTNNKLQKDDEETLTVKADTPAPKPRRRSSRGSRRSSSGSEKSIGKLKEEKAIVTEQPAKKLIADEEYKTKINEVSNALSKVLNDIQIIERDIILQSELMSSAATASKSLELISSLTSPLSEIQSVAEAAKESATVRPEIDSALFNSLSMPFKALYQSLTIMEKCIDVESDNKTLVKKTCISLIEKCGNEIQNVVHDINTLISKKYLGVEETVVSQIESLSNEMMTIIRFSTDTIKARNLLHEASEFKSEVPSLDVQHSKDTQKNIFELKTSLRSLIRIVESTERNNLSDVSKIKSSDIILNDMSASIQNLQEALEHIETLSIKESSSSLIKYNTEIIETVMDSIIKLRSSFEQLSIEANKEDNENTLKEVLSEVKLNLSEISSQINVFENKVGKFDILHGENKLEVLQKMAQTLIAFENSLPVMDIVPDVKENMAALHKHLTRVLENVIESNDGAKYFAFLEICDTISRVNNSIKNMETHDVFSLTSISNTLKIIQDQFIHKIFDPELNCSVLSSIEDIEINLIKNINLAEEVSLKEDFDSIQELQSTKQEELKANVVIQSIEHTIAAINHVMSEECNNEFKTAISPILQTIQPNLENLKQNIASLIAVETDREEHVSELSEISLTQTLANPLCELNQNMIVLNQTLLENAESFKEKSEVCATYAQPLQELLTMLEILQHEVISQHGEYLLPPIVTGSIANVVDNLQSCIVLIQEQAGIETADEMSTLEDVSGIKTTAEIMPSDLQVPLTTEEVYTEQLPDKFKVTQPCSMTADSLQALNEHAITLQHPNVIEFLNDLSKCSDYSNLNSVAVKLEELNEGIQEILHPVLVENTNEFTNLLDTSKLMQIAVPMQDLYHSLSVVEASNIPIYENILEMPSENIHSAIEKLTDFKERLETCLSAMTLVEETAVKTVETLSNVDTIKNICVDLKDIIRDVDEMSVGVNSEISSFKNALSSFLDAMDQQEQLDATKVKDLVIGLNEKLLIVQDELVQYKPQPCEKISQEVKLMETVHQLESNIAVLEQFEFVDTSGADDINSYVLPELAKETQVDSLIQIEDLVKEAVNIIQDVGHECQTADLMILEDFFNTCKVEFSLLRCLITKRPSHRKLIRLLQEFNFLRSIIDNFKKKRTQLSLSDDVNELLSNFIYNLDISMKDIEESLIKVVNSQSILLFDTPVKILDDNTKKIVGLSKVCKDPKTVNFINAFAQFIKDVRPNFNNLQIAIVEELQSSDIQSIKNTTDEKMDFLLNYIESEIIHLNKDDDLKPIIESILSCLQRHQECKDIVGQSKNLMFLKCLSECSTILKQIMTNETERNKQFLVESEEIALKFILQEMIQPLQGLRSQLISLQEQISCGADDESISIDITSTESYVQALTEINNDILQLLESEKTIIDESDLSLIEELDKELHIIQENIQSTEITATATDVTKQIGLPLENIEKSLILAKEKVSAENKNKISKDINSNISSLEYFLSNFIKLETDLWATSEIITDIDLKKCLSLAIEIANSLNQTELVYDVNKVNEVKNEKVKELTDILMKFDWLNTEKFYENKDAVTIEKMNRVFLSAYQLLSELNKIVITFCDPGSIASEDKAEILLQHINQYIEFIEIVEEDSAIIKLDDLLVTANIARELRESIDDVVKFNTTDLPIEIDNKQELLIHKLHQALCELEEQTIDSVLEMAPSFDGNKTQHIIEVIALLKADLMATTGIQVAVMAPEPSEEETKLAEFTEIIEEPKLIPEKLSSEDLIDTISGDAVLVSIVEKDDLALKEEIEEIKNQEIYEDVKHEDSKEVVPTVTEKSGETVLEDQAAYITKDLPTMTPTIGTLLEHIDEYICDDMNNIISQCLKIKDIKQIDRSADMAKELRDCIMNLGESPLEAVTILLNETSFKQSDLIWNLQEALNTLVVLTLQNAEELKPLIGVEHFNRFTEVIQKLHADIEVIASPGLSIDGKQKLETEDVESVRKQVPGPAHIEDESIYGREEDIQPPIEQKILEEIPTIASKDQRTDIEDIDSMKILEMLLNEVNNQVNSYATEPTKYETEDTEVLRNILDEVQTVIIKLKRDFDGSANDTLNETLEDLECSVRSVQLQIDENSAPDLLKDACATLQLLVTNMSDIKDHISNPPTEQTANMILEKCSEGAEQTMKLLDEAVNVDVDDQMTGLLTKLNLLKDTLKMLWGSFRGNADTLISKGIDVNQQLNQLEEQVFSFEKDIDNVSCKSDVRDSLTIAVHAVYESISNMRSAISSIQKEFMYENYGIPSEKFLHSIKNIAILHEGEEKINWKRFGKVLRQVLNHFEDIKFYVNFDKTARIPSDAAFTKIILDELNKELKNVVLPNVLKSYPDISEDVLSVINIVGEYNLSLQSRSTLEVKEKIPIFKNISELMFNLTNDLVKYKKKNILNIDKQKSMQQDILEQQPLSTEVEGIMVTVGDKESETLLASDTVKMSDITDTVQTDMTEDGAKQSKDLEKEKVDKESLLEMTEEQVEATPSCSFDLYTQTVNEPSLESEIKESTEKQEEMLYDEMLKDEEKLFGSQEPDIKINEENTSTTSSNVFSHVQEVNLPQVGQQLDTVTTKKGVTLTDEREADQLEQKEEEEILQEEEDIKVEGEPTEDMKGIETKHTLEEILLSEKDEQEAANKELQSNQEDSDTICTEEVLQLKEQEKEKPVTSQIKADEISEKEINDSETEHKNELILGTEKDSTEQEKQSQGEDISEKEKELGTDEKEDRHLEKMEQSVQEEAVKTEIDSVCLEKEELKLESDLRVEDETLRKEKELTEIDHKENQVFQEEKDVEDTVLTEKVTLEKDIENAKMKDKDDLGKDDDEEENHLVETEKKESGVTEISDKDIKGKEEETSVKPNQEGQILQEEENDLREIKEYPEFDGDQVPAKQLEDGEKKKDIKEMSDLEKKIKEEQMLHTEVEKADTKQEQEKIIHSEGGEEQQTESKEDEMLCLEKGEQDIEEKHMEEKKLYLNKDKEEDENKQLKDKASAGKAIEGSEIKSKKEEIILEDNKKEKSETKAKEEEKVRFQKENQETSKKCKEEDTLNIQKEEAKQQQLLALSTEEEKVETEIDLKEEKLIRSEKEDQGDEKKQEEEEAICLKTDEHEEEKKSSKDMSSLEKEKENVDKNQKEEEIICFEKSEHGILKEEERLFLEKEHEEMEAKCKAEERLCLEKEQQEVDIKQKEDDMLCIEKEQKEVQIKDKEEDKLSLEKEQREAEKKHKDEEKILLEKELQEEDLKRKEGERIRLEKDQQQAEVTKKEEEELRLEKSQKEAEIEHKKQKKLSLDKEQQEVEIKGKEEERICSEKDQKEAEVTRKEEHVLGLEGDQKESEIKRKDTESIHLEQEAEINRKKGEGLRLQKEQQESEIKNKEEEKIRLEKEQQEAEIQHEKEKRLLLENEQIEVEAKCKEDERLCLEKEQQKAEIKHEEEKKLRLEKEQQELEAKHKEDERFHLVKEQQEAEIKRKEEEKIHLEKEQQEAEIKRKEEEKLRLETEQQEAVIKRKEEEKIHLETEQQEAEIKRKEEEKLHLENEQLEAEIKRKEEEKLRLENDQQEAEIKRKEDKKIHLEKEQQEAEIKRKEEEKLRLENEQHEAEINRKEEEKLRLENEQQEAEIKRKEEEKLRLKNEQQKAEIKREEDEKISLEKEQQEAEIKRKKDEKISLEKDQQEAEIKRKEDEKIRLENEQQKAEAKRKEEEKLRLEKERQEAEIKHEEEKKLCLEKEQQEAEIKRKEEEKIRLEKEQQEAEIKRKEEEKIRLEKEQQEAEIKCKEEEKIRLEKEQQEAEIKCKEEEKIRLEKEQQEAEIKRKEEEKIRLENEQQEAEIKRKEEEKIRIEKEHQEAEVKRKEEERIRLEKEQQEAEIKRKEEDKIRLEQEQQELEAKRKEDERLHLEKEQQEAEIKRKEEEKIRLEKELQEAEIKRKEEEKIRLEKELQEAEIKLKEEESIRLQKEQQEAEIKHKEEEKIRLGKEQQKAEKKKRKEEERLRLEKEQQEVEAKRKEEETLRLEKEQQEADIKRKEEEKIRLEKEQQEADIKRKEEEKIRLEKEQQEAEIKRKEEEKIRLEKEQQEADIKRKEEERLRLEKEQQRVEAKRKEEQQEVEKKRKKEEKIRLKKEKQEAEKKQLESNAKLNKEKQDLEKKSLAEETLLSERKKQETEKREKLQRDEEEFDQIRIDEQRRKRNEIQEAQKLQSEDKTRTDMDKKEAVTKSKEKEDKLLLHEELVQGKRTYTKAREQKFQEESQDSCIVSRERTEEPYKSRNSDDSVYKYNGSMDKYKIGEIDISSLNEPKYEQKEKTNFINYNNNSNIGLEMFTPPGYIEKKCYESNRTSTMDIDTTRKVPTTYKAQTLLYQSQLRSSSPQFYETGRTSESMDKRSDLRQRSKELSETRSNLLEKRSSNLRDHKRKPVFSTYLTDRTAVEASRVKLTCSVLSSTDPKITWFKNGVLLDDKLKYKTKYLDGLITLEVLNAVPTDSAEYTCTVQNESGSVSTSANLKVYPSFEASPIPPTFTRSIRDTYHLADNELVLESRIRGQPLPTITWLKADRPLGDDDRYQAHYLADGVCRLVINAPVTTDSGRYTCKAENSMWSDQITHVVNFTGKESSLGPNLATIDRSRFNRQVLESRRPHFTNVLSDYKVTRGGTIGLQVEIKGSPTRVEWLREGNSVTETYRNAQTFVDRGLYTLALSDVTEKESGLYTCRAWSSHGNVDMNAAITVVQPNELEGKPAIIVGRPEKDVLISVGEDLNISFRAQGEPKPKVIFMKGIRDITNSQRVCKMTSDDYVKFTLKRSVVSDAGTYCILARNAYGCDRAFVTVEVRQRADSENLISDWTYMDDTALSTADRKYKSVPDRIPGEPSVVDGGNNWVSLAWPKPEHQESAPVLAYKVESWLIGKEGGARWGELGITPLNSFDAFNLKQGEEYHFRVTPKNRYGWGEPVQTSRAIGIGLAGDRPEFTEILPGQLKVLVGETANLSCSFKGKPTPEIVWMKNGHEIEDDDVRVKTLLHGYNCCLTIKDVQIEDEARYSCEASNVHGRASTYARMAVITDRLVWEADAKLKRERSAGIEGEYPPQFTMRLRDRRVQATYPVRLTCQVIGNPPPIVTWFKDGQELTYDNRHNQCKDEHFHTLEIAPTSLEDGGVYEAMARNNSGAVSCRCNLVVDKGIRAYVAPEFCCGLEPLYRLYEGEELRISAMVEAYPSVGVTWYRDGIRLRPSRRAIMTLDHDGQIELALASVTRRDGGVYTCTASNEVGQASTSGKVDVIGDEGEEKTRTPPVVISPDVPYSKEPMFTRKPRSSEAREGDTVIIECEVIGDPKPDVYWLRDFLKPDYYRDANHFKRVGAGPEYRFEIPHAKLDYTGTYSVVARNTYGEAKAIISLQILAKDIDASDEAHNVRYGRVDVIPRFDKELTDLLCYDGDAIEFECRVSGDPEPYIKWLHYNEVVRDSEDFETCYEEGTARLKIKQVTAEDEGTYTCEATNSLGKAKSSACLVVYPPGEPNTLSQRLRRPPALLSAASTPRSTPRATPARSLSRTPGPDPRRLCSPGREIAPKFYTYPFNKVVGEGERVVFKCAVQGLPNPWTTWDKDGVILTPTSRITMREKDEILRILEIEEVTIEDVGLYRITLENDYGRAEASARLEVITHKGKFYAGVRSCSPSPRRAMYHRRRTPSTSRQD